MRRHCAPSLDTSDQPCTVAPVGAVAGAGRHPGRPLSPWGPSIAQVTAVEGQSWAVSRGPPALGHSQALVTFRMERHSVTRALWKPQPSCRPSCWGRRSCCCTFHEKESGFCQGRHQSRRVANTMLSLRVPRRPAGLRLGSPSNFLLFYYGLSLYLSR